MDSDTAIAREISCRVTRTLLLYVRERCGSLGALLNQLPLDEAYLSDPNHGVSHAFVQTLYERMSARLGEKYPVYEMALASKRIESLGLLDWIARLLGSPKLIYLQAPHYNQLLPWRSVSLIRGSASVPGTGSGSSNPSSGFENADVKT